MKRKMPFGVYYSLTRSLAACTSGWFMERGKVLRETIVLKFPCGNLLFSSDFKIYICLSSKDLVLQVPMY